MNDLERRSNTINNKTIYEKEIGKGVEFYYISSGSDQPEINNNIAASDSDKVTTKARSTTSDIIDKKKQGK